MKIEIEIDEAELRKIVIEKISNDLFCHITAPPKNMYDYEDREKYAAKRKQEILDKIDWKNTASEVTSAVIHKFFTDLVHKVR